MMAVFLGFQRRLPGTTWVVGVSFFFVATTALDGGVFALLAALLFYATCPGMLVTDWFDLHRLAERVAFGVGASLSINLTTVTVLLALDRYAANRMEIVTTTLTLTAVLATAAMAWRSRRRRLPDRMIPE